MLRQATEAYEQKQKEIERGLTQQKIENQKMNEQLQGLKIDNDSIYQTIFECQKRLSEIEARIGVDLLLEI